MSQPPMYPQQPSPYDPTYGVAPARPGSVTGAAIVGIVLASVSLLCNLIGLGGIAVQGAMKGQANQPDMPGWITAIGAAAAVLFLVLSIVWLATSIGLLKLGAWAHSLATKLAPLHIVVLILWLGVNLILIAPETKKAYEEQFERQQQSSSQRTPPPPGFAKGFAAGAAYGGPVIGVIFALILPVTMLICLTRPSAKAAFARAGDAMG